MELVTPSFAKQRGLSLLYAMLALAALALASLALMRSMNTGSMVAGNLSFQQEATAVADQATRQALATLYTNLSASTTQLGTDGAFTGYYASSDNLIDVTGSQLLGSSVVSTRKLVKWSDDFCSAQATKASCALIPNTLASKINGNTAQYIVFRMCDATGDPVATTTINCARPLKSSASSTTNEARDYAGGKGATTTSSFPYYRIVVRVSGARNTVSYTETIVHF